MKTLLALALTSLAVAAENSVDLYVFGISHHANREVDWNERNAGLGIGLSFPSLDTPLMDGVVLAGTYRDSMDRQAKYALAGFRGLLFGERETFHGSITAAGGYFDGSGFNKIGIMVVGAIGYNRIDLCFTGAPSANATHETGDSELSSSGFVAAFLRIRALDF